MAKLDVETEMLCCHPSAFGRYNQHILANPLGQLSSRRRGIVYKLLGNIRIRHNVNRRSDGGKILQAAFYGSKQVVIDES